MTFSTSSTTRPQQPSRRRRGVLAMLEEPLPFYSFNPTILQETSLIMRKRRHSNQPSIGSTLQELPVDAEWTLFFLADSHNINSIRVRSLLAEFVQQSHSECCCICIPNRPENQDVLCGGTGFYCLPWTLPNRSAIIQLLSASQVPSVIVIENSTGRRLTDKGMEAIEANDAQELLKRWRRHESGLTWGQTIQSSCCIS